MSLLHLTAHYNYLKQKIFIYVEIYGGDMSTKLSRRSFITTGVKSLTILVGSSAAISFLESCSSDDSNPVSPGNGGSKVTIDLNDSKYSPLKQVGGKVALDKGDESGLPENGIFIIRSSDSSVTVLDRTCTHQGCQVNPFTNNSANCPCHGSVYNTNGGVVSGPADSPLTTYNATLNNNTIEISF